MEGVGQPCEMPGVIEYWDRMPALGQMRSESGASLGASLSLGQTREAYALFQKWEKGHRFLEIPGRCDELSMPAGYTSSAEGVGHT